MSEFTVPDTDFIEVDKEFTGGDDYLCWAAASCDALWYSQWANTSMKWVTTEEQDGEDVQVQKYFESPTDVFKYTQKYFNNYGGFAYWHMMWMICGVSVGLEVGQDILKQEGGGRYYNLTSKAAHNYIYCVTSENVLRLFHSWDDNFQTNGERCGVTASIGFGNTSSAPVTLQNITGYHEIPIWGFRWTGTDYSDPTKLTGIQVSDPDDGKLNFRYWLSAVYDSTVHMYKLEPENPSDVPDEMGIKTAPSKWLMDTTLIRQKPSSLIHYKNEKIVES